MSTMPVGIAVSDDVYTSEVVTTPSLTDRSLVHQLCDHTTTACGLSSEQVPLRIAAGYAAVIGASWCRPCFPATRAA